MIAVQGWVLALLADVGLVAAVVVGFVALRLRRQRDDARHAAIFLAIELDFVSRAANRSWVDNPWRSKIAHWEQVAYRHDSNATPAAWADEERGI